MGYFAVRNIYGNGMNEDLKIEMKKWILKPSQEVEDQGLIKIKLAAASLDCGPGQNWGRPRNENRIDIELSELTNIRGLLLRLADRDILQQVYLRKIYGVLNHLI